MTDVRELRTPTDPMPVRLWRATFAEDVDDVTDEAHLILPDFDPDLTWGPAYWRAAPHDTLPQEGDEALVAFDNEMQPWVASWWSGRTASAQEGDWPGSYPIVATDISDDTITMPKLAADVLAAIAAGGGGGGGWAGSYPIVAADIATGAVTSAKILDGTIVDVDVNASAAIAWSKINKTGSSIGDLTTRSAGSLNSGTLSAALLPAVAVKTTDTGTVTDTMLASGIAVNKLAAGTEGYTLKIVSGVPAWAATTGGSYPGTYPIVDADVAAGAAIAKSKLAPLAIADADVAAGAAIAKSKLNLATAIVNADISGSAAIGWTKINKAGSSLADLITRSATDLTSGTLLAARLPTTAVQTTDTGTVTNTMLAGSIAPAKISPGTESYVLTVVGGVTAWAVATGGGGGSYPGTYPIVNADVATTAAIAYSKLNLATSIVNADVAAGAAIAKSKLAALAIADADVAAGAAIAWTKISKTGSSLADLATRSATDLTSGTLAVAQLPASVVQTTDTGSVTNTMLAGSIAVSKLAAGTEGYVLKVVSGVPAWAAATGGTYPGTYPIVDADVATGAAIAVSKLAAAGTAGFVLVTTGGVPIWALPTSTFTVEVIARNTLASQVKIGRAGPANEAGISFGTATLDRAYLVASGYLRSSMALQFVPNATDTQYTWGIERSGVMMWGAGGTTAPDASIGRASAGALDAINTLYVGSLLRSTSTGVGGVITKTTPWYDIRAWGATGATDGSDRAAIQACITAASLTGATVFFPAGVWYIATPGLVIPANVHLRGVGASIYNQSSGTVITQYPNAATFPIFTFSDSVYGGYPGGNQFEHIQVYNRGAYGFYTTQQTSHVTFSHCMFTNYAAASPGYMFAFALTSPNGCERIRWLDCTFAGGGIDNIDVYATGQFFDKCTFRDCVHRDANGYALMIRTDYVRTMSMHSVTCMGVAGAGNGRRGSLYMTSEVRGLSIISHFSENIVDKGTTALVATQGDFVFTGVSVQSVDFISNYLCDGSSTATYAVNVPNAVGGAGGYGVHMRHTTWPNGTVNDPNGVIHAEDSDYNTAWRPITLASGWTTMANVGSRKHANGMVEIAGRIQHAAINLSGTVIATITDVRHRPNAAVNIPAICYAGGYAACELFVNTDGTITCYAPINVTQVWLEACKFGVTRP